MNSLPKLTVERAKLETKLRPKVIDYMHKNFMREGREDYYDIMSGLQKKRN